MRYSLVMVWVCVAAACVLDKKPQAHEAGASGPTTAVGPSTGGDPSAGLAPPTGGTPPTGGAGVGGPSTDPASTPGPAVVSSAPCVCGDGCPGPDCVPPPKSDGEACAADAECASGHCGGAFCCVQGPCCMTVDDCAASASGIAAICEMPSACAGARGEVICDDGFQCRTLSGVEDDSACDATVEANDCGPYPAVFCDGGADQTAPSCAADCADDDKCDDDANCDGGSCVPKREGGDACSSDRDCAGDHCQNGFCCADGDCCGESDDCPSDDYTEDAACHGRRGCQGVRRDPACSEHVCEVGPMVEDDSACDSTVLARACGLAADQYCSGRSDQSAPGCPVICTDDDQCDDNAHCESLGCVEDRPDGAACNRDEACESGHCQGGLCCEDGDCCTEASDCPSGTYRRASVCDDEGTCTGHRLDAECKNFSCRTGSTEIDDDRGCGTSVLALSCGLHADVYCDGSQNQSPSCGRGCTAHEDCDPDARCIAQQCQTPME